MDAGFSFCCGDEAFLLYIYGEKEGCTPWLYKAKAELTKDTDGLGAFGRPHLTSILYIGGTEASVLYIRVGLTSLLYIGEGGGVYLKIFFSCPPGIRRYPLYVVRLLWYNYNGGVEAFI